MKKTNLSNRIALDAKKDLPEKKNIDPDNIDKMTKKIHKTKEKTVRVTIDIPEQEYMKMKVKSIRMGVSVRRFFLDLLNADLSSSESDEL